MKRSILSLLVLLGLCIPPTVAFADAGSGSAVATDAGVTDAGSASATPAPAAPVIHDPSTDPAGFISDLKTAKTSGWGVAILVGVFGLCELLSRAKLLPSLAWLGKGRISIAIGAIAAFATTSITALAGGGTWTAVALAALSSFFLYLHPAGTDPAKA